MTGEQRWVREVYQGPHRQLTVRAVVTGMALGAVLCLSNLYVVLKTGWSLGVTITATIVAFGLFRALRAARLTRSEFSLLENNAVASIASSGAWMTGGGNMAALPALLLLTGERPSGIAMVAWFALIAGLGVVVAIPLKRQFINREQLPFPMSVATAEALKTMHRSGLPELVEGGCGLSSTGSDRPGNPEPLEGSAGLSSTGLGQSGGAPRRLGFAALGASAFTLLRDVAHVIPGRLSVSALLGLDVSAVLLGGGSLMQPRTAVSLLLGALIAWAGLAPLAVANGLVASADFKALVQFLLWPAAAMLTSAALASLVLQWRTAARALDGLLHRAAAEDDELARVEAPSWWFLAGVAVLAPPLVVLMWQLFGIPVWAGVAALPLAFLVGVIGARVTGETDVTPSKAMGPLTQLAFGAALPGNVTANVMGANVTAGVGLHAADLLSDLKTGWVLGADPRKQVWAQFLGIIAGALVVVPAFNVLVPDASVLGTEQLPAPAVMVWAGVSKVLSGGLGALPAGAREAMLVAGVLGAVLVVLERVLGPERGRWVPSPSALGIALVLPAATSLSMVLGAGVGALLRRRWSMETLTPVASGLIAGESVTGVLVALARFL